MSTIGKVYKIYSEQTNKVYIGSTTKLLLQRFLRHKKDYRLYNNGKFHFVTSFHILEYDDCNIELIEEVEFDDKKELIKRERYHIENNINCVNKRVEGRTRKEYNEQNREKISERAKQWYLVNKDKIKEKVEQNKEKISERQKKYRYQNREKISEQAKQNYKVNREKRLEKAKENYQDNKKKLSQKITCNCGSVVRKDSIKRHERSTKHKKYLETIV